jgi:hypothetical protein
MKRLGFPGIVFDRPTSDAESQCERIVKQLRNLSREAG